MELIPYITETLFAFGLILIAVLISSYISNHIKSSKIKKETQKKRNLVVEAKKISMRERNELLRKKRLDRQKSERQEHVEKYLTREENSDSVDILKELRNKRKQARFKVLNK